MNFYRLNNKNLINIEEITIKDIININAYARHYPNDFKVPDFILDLIARYLAWKSERQYKIIQQNIYLMKKYGKKL